MDEVEHSAAIPSFVRTELRCEFLRRAFSILHG